MELLPSDVESKTFHVVRKGYDPDEVQAYLKRVGIQMSGLEERAKIALVKADRLERKLLEAQRSADPVAGAYDEAFEIRRRLIAEAEEEAAQIRSAVPEVGPVAATEERVLPTEEQAAEILEAARAEAARIEEEAQRLVGHARSMANRMDAEATNALSEARARAADILAEAQAEAERRRPPVEAYRPPADGSPLREPAVPAVVTAEREEVVVDLTAAEEEVTVDLTAAEEEVTVDLTAGEEEPWVPSKPSRYMSRSAGLPRIGESASSVLGDMQKVRKKEGT